MDRSKTALAFEPTLQFKILLDLECSKYVQISILYVSLKYLLLFGLGGAVNTGEEKEDGVTLFIN